MFNRFKKAVAEPMFEESTNIFTHGVYNGANTAPESILDMTQAEFVEAAVERVEQDMKPFFEDGWFTETDRERLLKDRTEDELKAEVLRDARMYAGDVYSYIVNEDAECRRMNEEEGKKDFYKTPTEFGHAVRELANGCLRWSRYVSK